MPKNIIKHNYIYIFIVTCSINIDYIKITFKVQYVFQMTPATNRFNISDSNKHLRSKSLEWI